MMRTLSQFLRVHRHFRVASSPAKPKDLLRKQTHPPNPLNWFSWGNALLDWLCRGLGSQSVVYERKALFVLLSGSKRVRSMNPWLSGNPTYCSVHYHAEIRFNLMSIAPIQIDLDM